MKARLFLLRFASFILLAFWTISTCRATIVTFDELSETGTGSYLPSGYQGLVWTNFLCRNGILSPSYYYGYPTNGYYYGVLSVSNVVMAGSIDPVEINSPSNFNFFSAYLTGAWKSNLNIQVQGFDGGNLLYDQTVVVSATNPTPFTFNYQNINRLYFKSFGGQIAFGSVDGNQFVMDNFSFEFIPEPSTILLAGVGVLLLWPLLKRNRA